MSNYRIDFAREILGVPFTVGSVGIQRARDPEHQRLLPDIDLRALIEANGLVVVRTKFTEEQRNLTWYLDLADCQGEARGRAESLAPSSPTATVGWYLAVRPRAAT